MKPMNPHPAALTYIQTCRSTRHITSLLAAAASLVLACNATAATITTYDFQSLSASIAGGNTVLNNQDNWTAHADIDVILDGTSKFVAGYSNTNIQNANRPNNLNFAMTVPTAITQFSLSADIRVGTFTSGSAQYRRSMFGLTVGSSNFLFGAGGDDTEDNKWLIQSGSGSQSFSSAATTSSSSLLWSMKLDVDLSANSGNGAASLSVNSGSGFTAISDLQNINLNLLSLDGYSNGSSFDGMAISSGDFGRLDNLTLSYVPEPSSALLGGLGLLALLRRRR